MAEFVNMLRINRGIKPAKQKTMSAHKGLYFLFRRTVYERKTVEHSDLQANTQNIPIPYILP